MISNVPAQPPSQSTPNGLPCVGAVKCSGALASAEGAGGGAVVRGEAVGRQPQPCSRILHRGASDDQAWHEGGASGRSHVGCCRQPSGRVPLQRWRGRPASDWPPPSTRLAAGGKECSADRLESSPAVSAECWESGRRQRARHTRGRQARDWDVTSRAWSIASAARKGGVVAGVVLRSASQCLVYCARTIEEVWAWAARRRR